MCLKLNIAYEFETEDFRKSDKKLTGYKIMKRSTHADIDGNIRFSSVYQGYDYGRTGDTVISNRYDLSISEKKITSREVKLGLHFFMNIEHKYDCNERVCPVIDVNRNTCDNNNCPLKNTKECFSWVEFEIDPKDLIVVGDFWDDWSFVATKAKMIKAHSL